MPPGYFLYRNQWKFILSDLLVLNCFLAVFFFFIRKKCYCVFGIKLITLHNNCSHFSW